MGKGTLPITDGIFTGRRIGETWEFDAFTLEEIDGTEGSWLP
jgi:hypothetical protein